MYAGDSKQEKEKTGGESKIPFTQRARVGLVGRLRYAAVPRRPFFVFLAFDARVCPSRIFYFCVFRVRFASFFSLTIRHMARCHMLISAFLRSAGPCF